MNTAIGSYAMFATTTGDNNTAVGYVSLYSNTTGSNNTALGREALQANTTGSSNTAVGYQAAYSNTSTVFNTAIGYQAGYSNTTAAGNTFIGNQAGFSFNSSGSVTNTSGNIAIGMQAGYSLTTGAANVLIGSNNSSYTNPAGYYLTSGNVNTFIGCGAGQSATTGSGNTFIGTGSGGSVTTGGNSTILGRYNGNQGGLDIRTASNYIVLSDGDGNPRGLFNSSGYFAAQAAGASGYATQSNHAVVAPVDQGSRLIQFVTSNYTGQNIVQIYGVTSEAGINAGGTAMGVSKNGGTNRSINASGTINASGADYAEYMTKAGDFTIAKGDVVGIDANGKLTNVFVDAVSFIVKSTDPSYVGGDSWGSEESVGMKCPEPLKIDATDAEKSKYEADKVAFDAALEVARQKVDRVAFAGQVPVNVMGATPGQYIVPVNANGAIKGVAKNEADMTLAEYMKAVGKVIAIESDGRAKIIVKVA